MDSAAVGQVLTIVVYVAAGLLVPAGVTKLRDPGIAREALGLRRRGGDHLLRSIGLGELLLAAWVLLVGGTAALVALGLVYTAFTAVAARQRRRGASCGCFGTASAPTSWAHVTTNTTAALAAGALAATAAPVAALPAVLAAGLAEGAALLLGTLAAVASAQLVLTALPDLAAARRRATTGAHR